LLGDDKIVTVESFKVLRIIVNSELKFSEHIGHIIARAHARTNLIHKCFLSRDVQTLTRAFTIYMSARISRISYCRVLTYLFIHQFCTLRVGLNPDANA